MFTVSIKIGFTRKEKEITDVACHHCGKTYSISIKNIRATNYCTTCN